MWNPYLINRIKLDQVHEEIRGNKNKYVCNINLKTKRTWMFKVISCPFGFILDYRYQQNEIFKRMKITTFVQLVRMICSRCLSILFFL